MTYQKKLIEVALPLEAISDASAHEKYIRRGHPSTLHLWWARRPLAASRAVVFASLVHDPDDPEAPSDFVQACKNLPRGRNSADHDTPRQRLFDFIEELVQWDSTTDSKILKTARQLVQLSNGDGLPPLLDPFAGGGAIPLEAQRLGVETYATDLNPVAATINKALIEVPPRFVNMPPVNSRDRKDTAGNVGWVGTTGLASDVRHYGKWVREQAQRRIGHLYPDCDGETVIVWVWARTVRCPNPACHATMPLVKSFWLSRKKGNKAWLEPVVDKKAKTVRFEVHHGKGEPPDPPKVGRGAKFQCLVCGETAPDQHLKDEGMAERMGAQLIAIVTEGPNGRNYFAATPEHKRIAERAQSEWQPMGELADDTRAIWCKLYGLVEFRDLFTERQLVALNTFSDLVIESRKVIEKDAVTAGLSNDDIPLSEGGAGARAYAEAVSMYLAFGVDRGADYWSTLATWHASNQQVRSTFARHALPMAWDFVEANPFSDSSGSWNSLYLSTVRSFNGFGLSTKAQAEQTDATKIDDMPRCVISTDPPYYDNIGYADLSDFFYVWLRRMLKTVYPDIFSTLLTPKASELVASSYRFEGDNEAANRYFEEGLFEAFSKMRHLVHPSFPLTIYYAFKQSEIVLREDGSNGQASTGWETMLEGLLKSKFMITGTWPIRSEQSQRLISQGANALASSIVLVCRPRQDDAPMTSRREFVNALRKELPPALSEMQSGNIAPVDLAQASIGPGMSVYSRYSKVLEPNGDRLTVRTALQIINQELDTYLAEQEGHMDEDSRFAVAWFDQYGFDEGSFGQADVLARAKNTSVEGMVSAGILTSGAGKVQLRHWSDLDPGWDPRTDERLAVWEATHHLIERLNTRGEEGAARLLTKMPSELAADARQLAYRLYSVCERKGWAEEAREYNALVISWNASQEQAQQFKEEHYEQSSYLE